LTGFQQRPYSFQMAAAADPRSRDVPDWLNPRSAWIMGPSWVLSGVLHLTAAWLVWQLAQSPGCQARRGEQIVEGREVGIVVRERGPEDPAVPGASPPGELATAPVSSSARTPPAPTDGVPPVPLDLPATDPLKVIGMSAPPAFVTQAARAASGPLVQNSGPAGRGDLGTGGGNRSGTGSGNGTSMYGIPAKGRKFVYVIDRSSSMTDVLVQAKNELMASLRRLDESQAFQVIFFNDQPRELRHRFALFHGTEADRQLVEDQLPGISASGGTNRRLALLEALDYQPDVVYFLTDSEEEMSAAQREEVRRRLKGAQINCVEFGIGPPITDSRGKQVPNFLHKLAQESGGGYQYGDKNRGARR
jgi:hypothetical protein